MKKNRRRLLVFLIIAGALVGFAWSLRTRALVREAAARPQPDPQAYQALTRDLEHRRGGLAERYSKAKTAEEKDALENDARILLEHYLPEFMRCWLGTPWDFNGTAKAPGAGKIACGYFVATLLKDAGFQVDRYQLAQQPSSNILHTFLPKASCSLTTGEDYQAFCSRVGLLEPGVYLVGLDTHVAFIVVGRGDFRFVHSSGSKPWCVVDEDAARAVVLQKSSWRMLGNLTADPTVLSRWLQGDKILVKGS